MSIRSCGGRDSGERVRRRGRGAGRSWGSAGEKDGRGARQRRRGGGAAEAGVRPEDPREARRRQGAGCARGRGRGGEVRAAIRPKSLARDGGRRSFGWGGGGAGAPSRSALSLVSRAAASASPGARRSFPKAQRRPESSAPVALGRAATALASKAASQGRAGASFSRARPLMAEASSCGRGGGGLAGLVRVWRGSSCSDARSAGPSGWGPEGRWVRFCAAHRRLGRREELQETVLEGPKAGVLRHLRPRIRGCGVLRRSGMTRRGEAERCWGRGRGGAPWRGSSGGPCGRGRATRCGAARRRRGWR